MSSSPCDRYYKKFIWGKELDEEKRKILESDSPIITAKYKCIIAGPGSGKTHLLKHLIAHYLCVCKTINNSRTKIGAVSFNKEIAETLRVEYDKLAKEYDINNGRVDISTVHSLAFKNSIYARTNEYKKVINQYFAPVKDGTIDFSDLLFRKILPNLGVNEENILKLYGFDEKKIWKEIAEFEKALKQETDEEKYASIEYRLSYLRDQKKDLREKFIENVETIKNFIEQFENDPQKILKKIENEELLEFKDLTDQTSKLNLGGSSFSEILDERRKSFELSKLLLKIAIEYKQLKKENKWCDFNDFLLSCRDELKYLKENNSEEYRNRTFDYLLVDEFQDINPLHLEIIKLFLREDGKFLAVGDPRQSIYGWNGSSNHYIREFKTVFEDSEVFYLTKCYRCPQKVVDLANAITANEAKNEGFEKLISANPKTNDSTKIPCVKFDSFESEAKFWSKVIIDQLIVKRNFLPEDILVLSRTNEPLEVMERILQSYLNKRRKKLDELGLTNIRANYFKSPKQKSSSNSFEESISLMTIHKAKGTQAKVVIVIQASDIKPKEQEPMKRIMGNFGNVNEERNIFYVAVTRTKELPFCSYSSPTFMGLNLGPSKFIPSLGLIPPAFRPR